LKQHKLRITVVLTTLALLGLISTQAYWVIDSFQLSKKHYEHRAYVALDGAIEEIKRSTNSSTICKAEQSGESVILQIVLPSRLDSLLKKYIKYYQLDSVYEFAIVHSATDSIIFSTSYFTHCKSIETIHRHCLSCIYDKMHYHVELYFPHRNHKVWAGILGWMSLSLVFVLIIVFCFSFIVFSVFRHKKLSDMKTDFINNISHEFKTPISTISLASELLIRAGADTGKDKIERYSRIIYDENQRMRVQVEQVLRMTRMEKGETILNLEIVDANELIKSAVNNLCLEHSDKQIKLNVSLNAANSAIKADPVHFTNIIHNLVDNACKYSPESIDITITTFNAEQKFVFSIADKGLGISADKHKLIFEKFYRVPTGNLHDVKGFGIGLYYVKSMIVALGGKVSVDSEPHKGSIFTIELPLTT
jgi:two-component system phosphate regulon sensor histidine kinase PhoR